MNTQKGFISVLLILAGLVLAGGGLYVYDQKNDLGIFNTNENKEPSTLVEEKTDVKDSEEKKDINVNVTSKNDVEENVKQMNALKDEINTSAGKEIISKIATSTDSSGNVYPSLIVDPKNITEAMFERYDKNSYARNLLNLQITTMLGSFEIDTMEYKAKNGSYIGLCDNSKKILTSYAGVNRDADDELSVEMYKQAGITIDSYKIDESICKSNSSSFVITMPIPLKEGGDGTVCLSEQTGTAHPVVIGEADFKNFTCIKK
jgi:hypothetical protein